MTKDNRKPLTEPMSFNYRIQTKLNEGLDMNSNFDVENVKLGGQPLILTGILQKANVINQNGRIYPRNVLEREINNYKKFINERRSCGELDHPEQSVVEFKNVSHRVVDVWWEGNVVMGSIEILPTSKGKEVAALVQAKVKIGVSSRGVGSTKKDGDYLVVQDDFQLICWDIVTEPSTPMAFVAPGEGVQSIDDIYDYSSANESVQTGKTLINDTKANKIKSILKTIKG